MKTIFLIIISTTLLFSQGLINESANIVTSGTSHIVIANGANWTNNGVYTDNTGTVDFVGTGTQIIQGSNSTTFNNLTLNKSASNIDVQVGTNISVSNNLTMTIGNLDLQNSIVALGSTGVIQSETETNRIKVANPAINTGTITSTKTVNNVTNFDPANLGVKITTTQNLGNITIVRGHSIQTGSYIDGGGITVSTEGVERYYEIPGIGKLDVAAGIKVDMEYWDAELNGLTESQIEGFHWVTEGSSSSWWTPLDGSVNTSSNLFTTSGNPYGSYFTTSTWYGFTWSDKFILGSKDTPLPIVLTNIDAKCSEKGANIEWTTQSEINNDYFTIEKSFDGVEFKEITQVQGAGNSNTINNYNYIDDNNYGQSYYKLSQTDYNGVTETFKIISANCANINNAGNIILYPNPAINNTTVRIDGENNFTTIIISDMLGKQLILEKINDTENTLNINTSELSKGVYNIMLKSENSQVVKQLIITR